jgi:uncharacterized glyoxalase superfamily protein PhnB
MTTQSAAPAGYSTVSPYLVVSDAAKMLEFAKSGLGAEENMKMEDNGRVVHCEVLIGESMIMIGENAEPGRETKSMLYVYVPDTDAAYKRALSAGAESFEEPADQEYGDRRAGFTDPFGNWWFVATSKSA